MLSWRRLGQADIATFVLTVNPTGIRSTDALSTPVVRSQDGSTIELSFGSFAKKTAMSSALSSAWVVIVPAGAITLRQPRMKIGAVKPAVCGMLSMHESCEAPPFVTAAAGAGLIGTAVPPTWTSLLTAQ